MIDWIKDNKWIVAKYITLVCIVVLTLVFVLNNDMNESFEYHTFYGFKRERTNGIAVILMLVSVIFILFGNKILKYFKEW